MPVTERRDASVKKLLFDWTSDAGGAAALPTLKDYDGKLIGLTTIPAGGGAAPTDLYDLTLTDADGHDVLLGAGVNRAAAATQHVAEASLGAVAASILTLNVANAGNAKQGVAVVYVR